MYPLFEVREAALQKSYLRLLTPLVATVPSPIICIHYSENGIKINRDCQHWHVIAPKPNKTRLIQFFVYYYTSPTENSGEF